MIKGYLEETLREGQLNSSWYGGSPCGDDLAVVVVVVVAARALWESKVTSHFYEDYKGSPLLLETSLPFQPVQAVIGNSDS